MFDMKYFSRELLLPHWGFLTSSSPAIFVASNYSCLPSVFCKLKILVNIMTKMRANCSKQLSGRQGLFPPHSSTSCGGWKGGECRCPLIYGMGGPLPASSAGVCLPAMLPFSSALPKIRRQSVCSRCYIGLWHISQLTSALAWKPC